MVNDAPLVPEPVESQPVARRKRALDPFRPIGNWPPGYLLLWIVTLISVILNIVIIRQLLLARRVALQSVQDSIAVIDGLQHQVITYNVDIDQEIPLNLDVPIDMIVPIHIVDDFPIETNVIVSVPAGPLGTLPINVPISTTIPIDRTIDIPIQQTFTLDTSVPINFSVPIVVAIEETPLFATLEETKARLILLEQSLTEPLLPIPGFNRPAPPSEDINLDPPPTAEP